MIRAFKERRPWAAALVNVVFDPFLGMLYLDRGRIALFYLAFGFLTASLLIAFVVPLRMGGGASVNMFLIWNLPIRLAGAVHGVVIARKRRPEETVPAYARWYWLIAIYLAFPATAFAIRTFLYRPFNAVSASMNPTIDIGDYFFVSRRAFDGQDPQRGDIVAFRASRGDFVKRIVGVPNDRIRMVHGRLLLNGAEVPRRRIEDFAGIDMYDIARPIKQYVETMPSGRSFRILDEIDGSAVDDTAVFVVPADHYFVLGDNRDNSDDSRLEVGYVARRDILGKVTAKFADAKHKTLIFAPVE